jgi:hypothetical protein
MKKKFENLNLKNELTKAEMKEVLGGTSCSNGFYHPSNLGCGYCEATGRGTTNGCSSGNNPPCVPNNNQSYTSCSNGWSHWMWLGCGYCEGTGRGKTNGCC